MVDALSRQVLEKFHTHCCKDKKTLGFKELQTFLQTAQRDPGAEDPAYVLEVFKDYAQESSIKHSKKPSITVSLPEVRWSVRLKLLTSHFLVNHTINPVPFSSAKLLSFSFL